MFIKNGYILHKGILSGWIVSVWNTSFPCTGVTLPSEVQQVQVAVADGWQLTDFAVLAVCNAGYLLVDLLSVATL